MLKKSNTDRLDRACLRYTQLLKDFLTPRLRTLKIFNEQFKFNFLKI